MFKWLVGKISGRLVTYLQKTSGHYEPFSVIAPSILQASLQPGDVVLVEGNKRISGIIKYLTQSTWSHAAFYCGPCDEVTETGEPACLIEALADGGVVRVPLSKYANFNTRICRPIGLNSEDRKNVIGFMIASLGKQYDIGNLVDLMRYLIPHPPVPVRWRRRMLALGSGDPTRAICSTLIAQAFQSVRYPILPIITKSIHEGGNADYLEKEILHIRHYSLFTPRDFDISPYFAVVKPTIESGFDFHNLQWGDQAPS